MSRLTFEKQNKLKKKLNVETLWSFSSLNTYMTNKYEYFLSKILKIKQDREDGIYAIVGSLAHDILEQYYEGNLQKEDMIKEWQDKFLDIVVAGKKFNRTDSDKNSLAQIDYNTCMEHFFNNHTKANGRVKNEKIVLIKINNDIYFIGYIDLITEEKDTSYNNSGTILRITDFKTSTIYSTKEMQQNSLQLYLYAEGLRQQLKDSDFSRIKICYNFLKYANVEILQKNGKTRISKVKRSELINWVQDKLDNCKISDCIVELPLATDIIDECKVKIIENINNINQDTALYNVTQDENIFWQDVTDKNAFFASNLSGYSPKYNKPYKKYLIDKGLWKDYEKSETIDNIDGVDFKDDNMGSAIDKEFMDLFD